MILVVRIGSDSRSRIVVISMDYMNRGVWYCDRVGGFMLIVVVMKLIVFRIEEMFVKCREKIVRFIEVLVWVRFLVSGGYIVYFVFIFVLIVEDVSSRRKDGGRS